MFGFFKINEDLFFEELLSDDIDINKVQRYINKGVNINKRDEKEQTILFTLAATRKLEALKILIRNGANLTKIIQEEQFFRMLHLVEIIKFFKF